MTTQDRNHSWLLCATVTGICSAAACRLDKQELSRLGVHQLRRFLEALLQRRYLDSVPAIVPLLEREHRTAESRLLASKKELDNLATDKLRVRHARMSLCNLAALSK
jgi:hypothetical protein